MNGTKHNCELCMHAVALSVLGKRCMCTESKHFCRSVSENDEICERYQFGGFTDLAKDIENIKTDLSFLDARKEAKEKYLLNVVRENI